MIFNIISYPKGYENLLTYFSYIDRIIKYMVYDGGSTKSVLSISIFTNINY